MSADAIEVRLEMSGNLWKMLVAPGARVAAGEVLFIMEVMKMEVPHTAPSDGVVHSVHVEEGSEGLEAGTLAVVIEQGA